MAGCILAVVTSCGLIAAPSVASAVSAHDADAAAVRSFPAQSGASRKNVLAESTSVSSSSKSQWGGIESLNIEKTDSPAQIAAKKTAQEAENRRRAQQQAQQQAQQRAQAASRSQARQALHAQSGQPSVALPSVSVNGQNPASYALQFVGKVPYVWGGSSPAGWDCSGMVMYVMAQFGVGLPHSSGAQAGAGQAVNGLQNAKPGDILANGTHAAIYVGNGMVVNALNSRVGTVVSPVGIAFSGSYSIRRVVQ